MVGMIVKEDIERVRAAADLYDIVSATVTLKPSGTGTFVGLCPFHDEKTPSFSVRPSLGMWHCFGCGAGGDVFKYVEKKENIDFREAVEFLADRYHIEMHYQQQNGDAQAHAGSKRARLLEANEEAQKFFVSQLSTEEATPARELLAGRNFTPQQSAYFACGYAPKGWDNLVRYLANKGFTRQELLDAGLARLGQRGIYDYFRGRLTWPIRDSTGRTLGFGARKLYDDDAISAKYINTPDTALYRKTQVLYGIDLAKANIVKKRQVVIVEGYTDVMACHVAGIDTAVATCGTAFGVEHAKIVRRLIADDSLGAIQLVGPIKVNGQSVSSRIVFTFDGDAAGQKAALHAFGLDSAFLTQTFVAVADNNLDPCDLRIQRGDEAVRSLVAHASPLYDFVIDTVINRFETSYTTGQMGAVKAVAPLIAQIRDRSLLDLYMRKAVRAIGVDLVVMRREVEAARRRLQVRDDDAYASKYHMIPAGVQQTGVERTADSQSSRIAIMRSAAQNQRYYRVDDAVFMCEQQFMALLLQVPLAFNEQLFAQLTLNNFITPVFRTLFQAFVAVGGLPAGNVTQGLWLHMMTKSAGSLLESVITELSVMPLPLPASAEIVEGANNQQMQQTQQAVSGSPSDPLRRATSAESKYANELLIRLLDIGYMRRIGAARARMAKLPDGQEKLALLGQITSMEAARKSLQSQIM
ncbi:DNA primase [Gardnerella vaginalis]|uniref:DNA primase n=1 Tax=Gardnerella vaginalis TaxID=2702 RepID=A0A133NPF1_GARVA|nr:DNA primase [Gardnerella vaginalis]KXA18171.1 DNA primase [Gardnerella vaginalis]